MKVICKPDGSFELQFEGDVKDMEIGAAILLMRKLSENGVKPPEPPKVTVLDAGAGGGGIAVEQPPKIRRLRPTVVRNGTSRYYSVPRSRNSPVMAETYDYIAGFKRGRTSAEVAQHFTGVPRKTISTRLNHLKQEGLIVQTGGRGSAWVVTR